MRDWIGKCVAPLGWRYYALLVQAESEPSSGDYVSVGFLTTRTVLARTPRAAAAELIERLQRDPEIEAFFGGHGLEAPAAVVKKVWLPANPSKIPRTGCTFYQCTKE